jgi:hypothetical protein
MDCPEVVPWHAVRCPLPTNFWRGVFMGDGARRKQHEDIAAARGAARYPQDMPPQKNLIRGFS